MHDGHWTILKAPLEHVVLRWAKNLTKNVDFIAKTRNANFQLEMATFPTDFLIFFKIKRVKAIDKMDKLCKFHENPTKNVDFIA